MKIKITKAQGTGNDFIIIYDNKNHDIIKDPNLIQKICDRKNGIGADGLLLISKHHYYDYKMDYFNNDGSWETMCANGARCAALFMYKNNYCKKNITFITGDGEHRVKIKDNNSISLSMIQPHFKTNEINSNGYYGRFIDSGAKHFVTLIDKISDNDVKKYGSQIRNDLQFSPDGLNVNFTKIINKNCISVYTYEKGIENMVLSCGSGSVATAFYLNQQKKINSPLKVIVPGGEFLLEFNKTWDEVWLVGPAQLVFETKWNI